MLPVDAPPLPGEAFPSYLHRLADLMGTDPHSLYAHLRLRAAGKTIRYLHLALPTERVHALAAETRTEPSELGATLLTAYRGLDLNALTGVHADVAHRAVQRLQWLFLSGTRYCPRCLADGSPWLNTWQLPWT